MLKPQNRLKRKKDIDRVYRSKKSVFDPVAGIKWTPNDLGVSRVVIASGTRVSKKAVERNRVKRQYRAHMATLIRDVKIPADIMVVLSSQALATPFNIQREALHAVAQRAGLL